MNNSEYQSYFINMFEQYNLTSLDTESLDNDKIRRYTTEMREKYLSSKEIVTGHSQTPQACRMNNYEGVV